MRAAYRALSVALLCLLAACAVPDNRVVLLANDDGSPSSIVVTTQGGSAVLDHPGAAVTIPRASEAPATVTIPEGQISQDWGDAILFHPARPVTLRLYFVLDTTQLTPQSRTDLQRVLALIRERPAPEVVIIGHTDASGDPRYNYELGLRRAQAVAREVERIGVAPTLISVDSHGAGNPAVPNAKPYEPLNRRVEITVR